MVTGSDGPRVYGAVFFAPQQKDAARGLRVLDGATSIAVAPAGARRARTTGTNSSLPRSHSRMRSTTSRIPICETNFGPRAYGGLFLRGTSQASERQPHHRVPASGAGPRHFASTSQETSGHTSAPRIALRGLLFLCNVTDRRSHRRAGAVFPRRPMWSTLRWNANPAKWVREVSRRRSGPQAFRPQMLRSSRRAARPPEPIRRASHQRVSRAP
jgi:hypothetical protein